MNEVLLILEVCVLVAILIIGYYLVVLIRKATQTLSEVESTLRESRTAIANINTSVPIVMQSMLDTSRQLQTTLGNANEQIETLSVGLEQFKIMSERFNTMEAKIQDKVEEPLMRAASVVSGVHKALQAFSDGLKR